jgi:hypothetical protein
MSIVLLWALAAATPAPAPARTPWAEAGARPWTTCREYERQAERLLASAGGRGEEERREAPWQARVGECPNVPALLVTAALLELLKIPGFPPLVDLEGELPRLAGLHRDTRRQALAWLQQALAEAARRGDPPPPLAHYFVAYASLGLGDWQTARTALAAAERRGEVEPWRVDRAGAVAALLAGDLPRALALAYRARELAPANDRLTSLYILALVYDRAGAPEAAARELGALRTQSFTAGERAAVDSLLPLPERIYLAALEQQSLGHPQSALRLWSAYLACPEPEAPERRLVELRRQELRPRGSVVPTSPGRAGPPGAG